MLTNINVMSVDSHQAEKITSPYTFYLFMNKTLNNFIVLIVTMLQVQNIIYLDIYKVFTIRQDFSVLTVNFYAPERIVLKDT